MIVDVKVQDCIKGMKELAAGSVDVCVTSPPYNLGVKYRTYKDDQKRKDFLEWTDVWTDEVYRVLADNGSFFLNLGGCPKDPFLPHEIAIRLRKKWKLQNTFYWIKSVTIDKHKALDFKTLSVGHFKPINSKRFVNDCCEYVLHLTKTGSVPIQRKKPGVGVPYADQSNIRRWKHSGGNNLRCRGNVWFIPYKTIQSRKGQRDHPATFPVALPTMCLNMHAATGDNLTVLDPFVGLGSSLMAAQRFGAAKFIAFDIDDYYVNKTLNSQELL